jgi:hypothetical protein
MIIRKGQTQPHQGTEKDAQEYGARESVHPTEEGRATQFGAHVQTLQPGAYALPTGTGARRKTSSPSCFLARLPSSRKTAPTRSGLATRPAGRQAVNRSGVSCTYLIFGSGAEPDVVHYPDRGDVLYDFEDGRWRIERTDGTVIRERRLDPGRKRVTNFSEARDRANYPEGGCADQDPSNYVGSCPGRFRMGNPRTRNRISR